MDIADNVEFRNRLVALAEVFDLKLAATRQALYFEALRDVPFEAVARALNAAVKTCKFFPRPAELRTLALGDAEDCAEAAWLLLRTAMRDAGGYRSIATSDPALGETIVGMFGTWPAACAAELSPEMWTAKRKEFGRMYRVFLQRQLTGSRYLPGITEQANGGRAEWTRYTEVALLEGGSCLRLGPAEAERYRTDAAAIQHGMTRVGLLESSLQPLERDDAS